MEEWERWEDITEHLLRQLNPQAQAPVNIFIVPTLMQARRLGVTQENSEQ
jgi:hypothetical protein